MSLEIALHDAATNCQRDGAKCGLTLKSGVQFFGKLDHGFGADLHTVHMHTQDGGWITVLVDELAAVAAIPRVR